MCSLSHKVAEYIATWRTREQIAEEIIGIEERGTAGSEKNTLRENFVFYSLHQLLG
jgi:hypothetical protein